MSKNKIEEIKNDAQETLENAVDAAEDVINDVQDKIEVKKPGFLKKHGKTIVTHTVAFIAGICVATVKGMFFGETDSNTVKLDVSGTPLNTAGDSNI